MKQVFIFGGTTEGRELAENLSALSVPCVVSVASEYGKLVMPELPGVTIRQGRMTEEEMAALFSGTDFLAVVDATHPFATEVSANIREATRWLRVPYLRLKRPVGKSAVGKSAEDAGESRYFADTKSCAEALKATTGNILLTTGSKELPVFVEALGSERLFVRALPDSGRIRDCEALGIKGRHLIALQGPFSARMNEAMIREYDIRFLVTKETGAAGGFQEKLEAAATTRIPAWVIGNPDTGEGAGPYETLRKILELAGIPVPKPAARFDIALIGIGMGSEDSMTVEAMKALNGAKYVFGAERLLKLAPAGAITRPYYRAEQILPFLLEEAKTPENALSGEPVKAAALFSGDTGFYSGAEKFYQKLGILTARGAISAEIELYPGISTISYLSAKTGISWQDARIMSIHGREADVPGAVRKEKKIFLILSGAADARKLGNDLMAAGLPSVRLAFGYQLSYPEEWIRVLSPEESAKLSDEGLYACFILNDAPEAKRLSPGVSDEEFIRDKVPMTKEEIREVSICALGLTENAVVYDVGSGTGSVAVECALLSDTIRVLAIERLPEAVSLIRRNKEKFRLSNMEVVEAKAPDWPEDLPRPTHAFIGGSGGNLKQILDKLSELNDEARIVINAVTLETISEVTGLLPALPITDLWISQLQVSRAKPAGKYHLMRAENPVMVFAFRFRKEE